MDNYNSTNNAFLEYSNQAQVWYDIMGTLPVGSSQYLNAQMQYQKLKDMAMKAWNELNVIGRKLQNCGVVPPKTGLNGNLQ